MIRIGIMQGRLLPPDGGQFQSFPQREWRREFALASAAGFDAIEWIYDQGGEAVNPLGTLDGIREMARLAEQCGVRVSSVCADYFMDRPFVRVDDEARERAVETLRWLLRQCRLAGIERVVLPFVDQSRLEADDEVAVAADVLNATLPDAERNGVELHLEMSLGPRALATLLDRLPHRHLRVTYDSGNSASLGHDVREEFAAYGDRIGSVHVKDRRRGGGTVPLGQGDVDFPALFDLLQGVAYQGDLVLQVARGEPHFELDWAKSNLSFVLQHTERCSLRRGAEQR